MHEIYHTIFYSQNNAETRNKANSAKSIHKGIYMQHLKKNKKATKCHTIICIFTLTIYRRQKVHRTCRRKSAAFNIWLQPYVIRRKPAPAAARPCCMLWQCANTISLYTTVGD